jgi:hypothetical protein
MEHDTCLAYDISLQFGESINVMDWFSTFASRVQSSAGALPPALTNPGLDEKEAGEKKGGAAARRVSKSNKRKAPPPSSVRHATIPSPPLFSSLLIFGPYASSSPIPFAVSLYKV